MVTTRPKTPSYIIKRPRLTKLLDESEARIILLCAPAGYGKTTLAREWVEGLGSQVAWYSGGSEMCDAAGLAVGLASALDANSGREGLASSVRAAAAQTQDAPALARLLAAGTVEANGTVLVIDDYHNVADSTASEELLATFARLTSVRIMITSRTRPHWLSSRLTIYGEALVIGREELAFTSQEARAVLPKTEKDGGQRHFLEQAKGWPAVIGLAAIRGRAGTSPASSLLPAELYEYFAEDLFESTPFELRRCLFLLALGTAHRMIVARDLVDDESGALIKEAFARGFVAVANDRVEIHPLLRGFLRGRLRESAAKDDDLVSHALRCFAKHGEWAECVETLVSFPESSLISVILDQALPDLLASGRAATVRRWADLARTAGHNEPTLLIAEAELALRERGEATAQMLSERAGELLKDTDAAARAYVVAARAAHLRGDASAAKRNAKRAQALTRVTETLVAAQWLEFVNAAERQEPGVESIVRRLRATAGSSSDHLLRVVNAEVFLHLEVKGDIREAVRQAVAGARAFGDASDPLIRTTYLNLSSSALIYLARYDRALEFARLLTEDARSSGLEFAADHALLTDAGARIGRRQLGLAQRALHELETRGEALSTFVQGKKQLRSAQLSVAAGDLDGAERVLRARPPTDLSPGFQGEWLGTRAVILAALGDKSRAVSEIGRARDTSKYADAICLAELATAMLDLQAHAKSAEGLARFALAGVLERGFLDLVVFACRADPALAAVSAGDPGLASEMTTLLCTSRDFDVGRMAGLPVARHYRRGEELSPRERDVCELLSRGRSNREIASALFISESTAKVHVRHIYEKLEVRNRAEAVARLAGDASATRSERPAEPRAD